MTGMNESRGSDNVANTLTQNENFTLFLMGFTMYEMKTHVPLNAGNEIQSCGGMLNFISG